MTMFYSTLNWCKIWIARIASIIYPHIEQGQIYKIYDTDHCLVRYNMMKYKREKIKGLCIPRLVDKKVMTKIMHDITGCLQNKSFHIKRMHRDGSIYLYENDALMNNTINNVIVVNILRDDDLRAIAKLNEV